MKRKLNFRDTVTVKREMGDRYFPNEMPDYIPETATAAVDETITERNNEDSLTKLLSLPYNILSQRLKASALELKDTVVRETWGMSGKRVKDYSLYTGALGTAYLLFKAYQVTKNQNDLNLCSDIIKACDSVSRDSGFTKLLSPTDISHRLTIPMANLGDFELPTGQHAINIEVTDTLEQPWIFKLSIRRNNNPNPRPVFTGEWIRFVKEKGLRAGDRVVFSRQEVEGNGVQYRIRAERKIFKYWVNVQ